jgi:ABC-2 type transport system permease protein
MKDLMRVIANEWMKLLHRKRLLVVVFLAFVSILSISVTSYIKNLDMMRQESPEGIRHRIAYIEETLKQSGNPRMDKHTRNIQLEQRQGELKELQQTLKRYELLGSDKWRTVLEEDIKKLEGGKNNKDTLNNAANEMRLMELNYYLKNNIKPTPPWLNNTYEQIDSLLNFFRLLLPLLVVVLVADIVSGETALGTIKLLLIRPISRFNILLGKWIVSVVGVIILCLGIFALLFVTNGIFYGFSNGLLEPKIVGVKYITEFITNANGFAQNIYIPNLEQAKVIPMWQYLLYGILFTLLSMITVASVTFFFSTVFKSPMISTSISFALIVFGEVFIQLIKNGKLTFWLFSTHLNLLRHWTGAAAEALDSTNITLTLGIYVLIAWTIISLVASFVIFVRKDFLNS